MKGVSSTEHKTIGVFIPQLHKCSRQDYLQQLSDYARDAGYRLMCFTCYSHLEHGDPFDIGEASVFSLAKNVQFSAMVVYNELIKDAATNEMLIAHGKALGIPVFAVDHKAEGTYYISYNYGSSFEKIVDHVIEHHGCRNIYMISGQRGNEFSDTREAAYRKSLEKHGIEYDDSKVYFGYFWDRPALEATEKLLADCGEELPDAIVCGNDTMAIAVCNTLEKHNIKVPDQIIVTGFDGIDRSRTFFPTISTGRPEYEASTKFIVDTIAAIDSGAPIEPCESYFDFRLQKGQSCGCEKITGSSAGLSNSTLYELIREKQLYTAINDVMVLSNTDGSDIITVLNNIKKYMSEVLYAGIELYLDPTFFGDPTDLNCHKVLAARLAPEPHPERNPDRFSVPFEPKPADWLCSDDLFYSHGSVLFVPVHRQENIYGYIACEMRMRDLTGAERVYDFVTHLNFLLSSIETTSKLHEVIEELNKLYVRDQLTDLLNRHGFYRELKRLTGEARRMNKDLTFISADLDGLKYINDNYGHSEGDFAIVSIANLLTDVAGMGGVCARFGGDEYLAACISSDTPEVVGERFKTALAEINAKAGKPYPINASFGIEVASPGETEDNVEEIIRRADNKMFEQKRHSKFSRDMKWSSDKPE